MIKYSYQRKGGYLYGTLSDCFIVVVFVAYMALHLWGNYYATKKEREEYELRQELLKKLRSENREANR